MSYLDQHRARLQRLFEKLGEGWPADDDALIAQMERRWLRNEHGASEEKPKYGEDVRDEVWPVLRELDLVDRIEPSKPRYDQVVVMGATGIGLHRRFELVRESGVAAERLTVLAGMRPNEGNARDGGVDELLAVEGRFASVEGWQGPKLAHRQAELLSGVDPYVASKVVFPAETDLARLLLTKQWPDLELTGIEPAGADVGVPNDIGVRRTVTETYRSSLAIPEFVIVNGASVPRQRGGEDLGARPTARSTVREWLGLGLASGDHLLVVVNQPHLTRVRIELIDELRVVGRRTDLVEVVGAHALQALVDINLLLGEIPARINAERATGFG